MGIIQTILATSGLARPSSVRKQQGRQGQALRDEGKGLASIGRGVSKGTKRLELTEVSVDALKASLSRATPRS